MNLRDVGDSSRGDNNDLSGTRIIRQVDRTAESVSYIMTTPKSAMTDERAVPKYPAIIRTSK
jgi:hypothetical protein